MLRAAPGSGKGGEDWKIRHSWEPACFLPLPRPAEPTPLITETRAEPFLGLYVILSLCLCSVGGLILDKTVSDPNFAGMAVFTPVINGVGGNLVAVQASRISTFLHMNGMPGENSEQAPRRCPSPCTTFFSPDVNSRSARVLFLLVVPGHLVFLYTISCMQGGHTTLTLIFIIFYMTAALLQVLILLYIADWMVHWMWGRGLDPDNFSIPYLTALGDLLGTGLLALSFHILWLIGDRDTDVGD
uniref:Solute carrier family 41 member n=1 Tax=Prolemur simus TaxID=1328070 RepID=A0A8C8YZP3_PROSS